MRGYSNERDTINEVVLLEDINKVLTLFRIQRAASCCSLFCFIFLSWRGYPPEKGGDAHGDIHGDFHKK